MTDDTPWTRIGSTGNDSGTKVAWRHRDGGYQLTEHLPPACDALVHPSLDSLMRL